MQTNTEKPNLVARKKHFNKEEGIIQVFMNVDMRNMHEGLAEIASKNGINVQELKLGQFVVFINAMKTRVKIFAANDVVAYQRSRSGKIQMETIQRIPESFGAGGFDYDSALRAVLTKLLTKQKREAAEALH